MAIMRVTALWTGFPGAPGYSSLHFLSDLPTQSVDENVGAVHSFFDELNTFLPTGTTVQVQQETELLDENTGMLLDYYAAADEPSPITGGSEEGFAGPVGTVITWNTSTVNRGRRVRGRTFIVPLTRIAYGDDGTLTNFAHQAMQSAGQYMLDNAADNGFCVWSRPRGGSGGVGAPVTGYRAPDFAAVLRSRRD